MGVNGAPNKEGSCAKLLKRALKAAEKSGARTKIIHLIDEQRVFFHSHLSRKPEKDFIEMRNMLLESDGFILTSPVYWMNVSALMKNFIDKLTVLEEQGFLLEGKVAGFIVTENEGGGWEAIKSMAMPLNHMGVLSPPYSMIFHNFNLRKQKISRWMDNDIELLGKNIVTMCKMIRETKPNWDYDK